MNNVNELVVGYVAAWNERDDRRRREIIANVWTENGTYLDAHRHGEGHDAIDAMIKVAQDQFPGYRLRLVSGIEAHNGNVRSSWGAGGAPARNIAEIETIATRAASRETLTTFSSAPAT
jgi:hypothetical protein